MEWEGGMIQLFTTGLRIVLVAVAMTLSIPAITFAQTPESATESEPTAGDNASPVQAANGPEDNTSVEPNPPAKSVIPQKSRLKSNATSTNSAANRWTTGKPTSTACLLSSP